MKTKITLVTGESYVVDKSVDNVIEATTSSSGAVFNDYVKIKENVWITPAHIVKLEKIEE